MENKHSRLNTMILGALTLAVSISGALFGRTLSSIDDAIKEQRTETKELHTAISDVRVIIMPRHEIEAQIEDIRHETVKCQEAIAALQARILVLELQNHH